MNPCVVSLVHCPLTLQLSRFNHAIHAFNNNNNPCRN